MKLSILCVGKIKEAFYRDAVAEYSKRLSRYCRLEIIEVADEKTPENASPLMETQIRRKEGERLLARLDKEAKDGAFVCALAIDGKQLDSVELSEKLKSLGTSGTSHIVFLIGGSLGMSEEVLRRADFKLSFSKMTFPHQLMRVILLEQLKAFTLEATKDLIMPTKIQKEGEKQKYRAADVYLMQLPDGSAAKKKVPYIIHQAITGRDSQAPGERETGSATVRTIFAVYNDDGQEGGLMLLNLMERLRIALLRKVVIGGQFQLDLEAGIESFIYPATDEVAPYYAGEMSSVWRMPAVEREVDSRWNM